MSGAARGPRALPGRALPARALPARALLAALAQAGPGRCVLVLALLAATLVVLAHDDLVRHAEACLSAEAVRATGGVDVSCAGDNALYRVDGLLAGHTVTIGCSAVVLLLPFVLLAAGLLPVRRIPAATTLGALAAAAGIVVAVNQARLLVIATGVRTLGLERGYGLTHVLAGTVVSTLGLVTAGLVFVVLLTRGSGGERGAAVRAVVS